MAGDDARHRSSADSPPPSAGPPARTAVVGSGGYGASQVRMAGGDARAEHGDGDSGSLGGPPRLSHPQPGQPPLLGADSVSRPLATGCAKGRRRPKDPEDGYYRS